MRINNVCVIGLGYVGLTLAATLADVGFMVFGVDKNENVLNRLKMGEPHFHEKGLKELLSKYKEKRLSLLKSIPGNEKIDAFIISVATPIDKSTKLPKIEFIKHAIKEILPHLKDEQLIILRSTVPVGTTRQIVLPMLKEKCSNFYLSFCPERTVEGRALIELRQLPQIIGGLDEESIFKSIEIFSKVTPTVVRVSSLETAEITKLIDNSYRDLTFAFANQIGLICKNLGLDANETIKAANLGYSRNNIPLPGFVGGICLKKDPHVLINSAGMECDLLRIQRKINEGLILHLVSRIKEYLKDNNKDEEEVKLFISGFAFKGEPETDDLRDSPTIDFLDKLKESTKIKNIFGHDFIVKEDSLKSLRIIPCSLENGFKDADVIVFMNNHRAYQSLNIEELVKKAKKGALFFDGWQVFSSVLKDKDHIIYESLGFKK